MILSLSPTISMGACSLCLRAMRKQARIEQLIKPQISSNPSRSLSSTAFRKQQSQPRTEIKRPRHPVPLPTTTPTITSNVTAESDVPESQGENLRQDNSSEPSTAEMQRRISANLRPEPLSMRMAKSLRKVAKSTTDTYITYGVTEAMVKSCAAQAAYTIPEDQRMGVYTGNGPPKNARQEDVGVPDTKGSLSRGINSWWFGKLGLEPTFSVWSQVSFLHMYLLTVKMRTLPDRKQYLEHQRYLFEHFSADAEEKMILLHSMNARGVRNKYLKDLFQQWRGVIYAYDEGLVKGDAVLAAAVWRNLWKADEDVDWEKVAMVVAFMRKTIAALNDVSLSAIAAGLKNSSKLWETNQRGFEDLVDMKSRGIKEPIADQGR